jgi:hypothetical protein
MDGHVGVVVNDGRHRAIRDSSQPAGGMAAGQEVT